MRQNPSLLLCAVLALVSVFSIGCAPYEVPIFKEIGNHQTAFVLPLDGATSKQKNFESAEYLASKMVAAKRIQIPQRWVQMGRMWFDGHYIEDALVITVDRTPVAREWTPESNTGTSRVNQAIWLESRDSVGFSTGFNVSAMVEEKDCATFLYYYPTDKDGHGGVSRLSSIVDNEVRQRISAVAADFCAGFDLKELRGEKAGLLKAVREDVVPFFKERGVTITSIGLFGGFTYENPKVQAAIDEVFVAQQEEAKETALIVAAEKQRERLKAEGEAEANKAREIAQGQSDARVLEAEGEAKAIDKVVKAFQGDAIAVQAYMELKKLELETERIKAWDGSVPQYLMQSGGGQNSGPIGMLFSAPELKIKK